MGNPSAPQEPERCQGSSLYAEGHGTPYILRILFCAISALISGMTCISSCETSLLLLRNQELNS